MAADQSGLDPKLARALREAEPAAPELASLLSAVERDVAAERGLRAWLRARSTPVRVLCLGGAAVLVAVLSLLGFARADLASYPPSRMLWVLAVAGAGIGLSLRYALRPAQQAEPSRALAPGLSALGLGALMLVYLMPEVGGEHAHGLWDLVSGALPCLGIGTLVALVMYAVWAAFDRAGARRGVWAALFAGLTANVALQLHCPMNAPGHLVLGHLGVALLMVAAALAARR